MLTVIEKINIGKTSSYLIGEELDSGAMHSDINSEKQRILLRMATDIVETQYNADPTDSTLEKTSNYVLRLSKFKDKAQEDIADGGSGSVADPAAVAAITPYDFYVGASSFIATGDTSKVFPAAWRGFNILFIRGFVPQTTVDDGTNTFYSWDRNSATLTLGGGAAAEFENFQIYPV